MSSGLRYNSYTVMDRGKYKSYCLSEIPADYLLAIHTNPQNCEDSLLVEYVAKNIERIKAKKAGLPFVGKSTSRFEDCKKIKYLTKPEARRALKRIRKDPHNHKIPIRSYECEKCSYWHLTSMPIEVWKEIKKQKALL